MVEQTKMEQMTFANMCYESLDKWRNTLPKTNIAPENQWLEDVFPTEMFVPF